MSDLDYDAIREKWLQPCGACDAGLPMSCVCPSDDPRPVILDLAQRAEADRAAVERVRALLVPTYATASDETWGTNGHVDPIDPDDLRAALDPKEYQ